MTDQTSPRVLVLTDARARIEPILQQAHPGLDISYCETPDRVAEALETLQPDIVFGIPGEPVPKARLREVLLHPSVRWFSNGGAGIEHLLPWDPAQKTVTNASGVNAPFLAQYTITALMGANIGFPRYHHQQQSRRWARTDWPPIEGRKLCVVGLGSIGRAVAAHAAYFGFDVVGVRGSARPTEHVRETFGADRLLDALDGAEFVSVHAANTPETQGMIDAAAFEAMADGVIFLNAARGPVVEEAALLSALDSGKIGHAILDVFHTEPLPEDHPLWTYKTVQVTPHMADSIAGWEVNLARAFAQNLSLYRAGAPVTNIIDPTKGY